MLFLVQHLGCVVIPVSFSFSIVMVALRSMLEAGKSLLFNLIIQIKINFRRINILKNKTDYPLRCLYYTYLYLTNFLQRSPVKPVDKKTGTLLNIKNKH